MKRCEVQIPFHLKATDTIYVPGDTVSVSDEQLAKILAINKNMVIVLGEEPEETPAPAPKKRKTTKKTANK